MQITFYGTGSCMPSSQLPDKPVRSYSGWHAEIGSDSLLFDIGGGVIYKMASDGLDILKKPTHLFISHFHPDHCSDLITLMQGRGVANAWGTRLASLFVGGPEGLRDFCKQIFEGVLKWRDFIRELDIYKLLILKETMSGIVFESDSWKVGSSPIEHFNGVCYRLEAHGKSIIYSGDMVYDERICKLGKDADLAIMECCFPDRESLRGKHLCPEDIGRLSKLGNFKKVALTHMYPACEGREEEMVRTIQNIANVEVIVPQDFQKLEI